MKTKEKILRAALELYNDNNVITITSRHIAASMGISPGNLHYHFRHTDDIIAALYARMAEDYNSLIQRLESDNNITWNTIFEFTDAAFHLAYKYRCIFMNLLIIADKLPEVKEHYNTLMSRREKQFKAIFYKLVSSGQFRDDIPDQVWSSLSIQTLFFSDFWISHSVLRNQMTADKAIAYYRNAVLDLLYPFLQNPTKFYAQV